MQTNKHKPNFDKLTLSSIEYLLQRERFEELLYEVCEAVVGIDQSFKITLFNRVAENMTGIPAEKAHGKDISEIVTLLDQSQTKLDLRNVCFKSTSLGIPNLIFSGSQCYSVNFKSTVIQAPHGTRECLITLSDVTKEKAIEKLKDELFSVASHELKTPITIIKSYLWMLQNEKGGPLNQKQNDYVKKAVNATERILTLVNDILGISRLEQGRVGSNIREINLTQILKEVLSDFEAKAHEKNLRLIFDEDRKETRAMGDTEHIKDTLVNLVENAIKFTETGEIRVALETKEDLVKISITDTGVGIEKDDLPKLFHKFGRLHYSYQAVAETRGTGLGLYIVKLYVEGMHGNVGAESDGPGHGSTFWFTLPKVKTIN